ncbi:hypothetical protein GCM10029964_104080 [Kibdelosporangium lantanae]
MADGGGGTQRGRNTAGVATGGSGYRWSDLEPGLAKVIRASFPDLPLAAVALSPRVWGRMDGLVALEIYGTCGPRPGRRRPGCTGRR